MQRCLWGMNSFSDSESKSSLKLFLVPEIFQTRITDSKEVAFLIDWRVKLIVSLDCELFYIKKK